MEYIEVLNNLQKSINEKGFGLLFSKSIKDLNLFFKKEVSTKFLRGLSDLDDSRKKTRRINYLIRKNNLKTKRTLNIYEVRGVNKYKTDVVTWGHDKRNLPFKCVGLTAREENQIREIAQLKKEAGISLFDYAENDFNNRQKTTNAFNLGGGAVVRDVRVIKVGNYAVTHKEEVLYMIY